MPEGTLTVAVAQVSSVWLHREATIEKARTHGIQVMVDGGQQKSGAYSRLQLPAGQDEDWLAMGGPEGLPRPHREFGWEPFASGSP